MPPPVDRVIRAKPYFRPQADQTKTPISGKLYSKVDGSYKHPMLREIPCSDSWKKKVLPVFIFLWTYTSIFSIVGEISPVLLYRHRLWDLSSGLLPLFFFFSFFSIFLHVPRQSCADLFLSLLAWGEDVYYYISPHNWFGNIERASPAKNPVV